MGTTHYLQAMLQRYQLKIQDVDLLNHMADEGDVILENCTSI